MSSPPQQKLEVQWLDPKVLEVPEVRITSTWDPEMLAMLKKSVATEGIQTPLIVIKENDHYWLVDGLHRRDEALLQGIPQVPCVVTESTMRKVMTRNLYMNRLRGGIKASEMIKVIHWLETNEGMNSEAINRETGLNRDYIEKLQQTAKAVPEVIDALDREEIGVGHAFQISRIPDKDVELRLLAQIFQYRLTVKDLTTVVDDTIEILKRRAEQVEPDPQQPPVLIPKIRCGFCGEEYPIKKVTGVNCCMSCYGLIMDAIKAARKRGEMAPENDESHADSQESKS